MYCDARYSMISWPAITTSTVVNVVRRTSGIEIPSTPRW